MRKAINAAIELSHLLYPQGQWIGTRTLHEDNKTRDRFCTLAARLRDALANVKPREWSINIEHDPTWGDKILGGREYGRTCGVPGNAEQVRVREVIE